MRETHLLRGEFIETLIHRTVFDERFCVGGRVEEAFQFSEVEKAHFIVVLSFSLAENAVEAPDIFLVDQCTVACAEIHVALLLELAEDVAQ